LLAIIYYDQGDYRAAMPQLEDVAHLDPTDERPHNLIGIINKDLDRPQEAAAAFKESLRRNPNGLRSIETHLDLAEVQIKNREPANALELLKGLDSDRAVALRAEAMVPLGQGAESVAILDEALKKYPDHGGLLRLRAERYRDAGDNESAVQLLE